MLKGSLKSRIFEYSNLIAATIIIFAPILYSEIYLATNSDYGSHISWAQNIIVNPQNVPASVIAHASWQWLVLLTQQIVNRTWNESAFIITVVSVIATTGILYWLLRKQLSPLVSGVLSIGLVIIAPIFIIEPFDNLWYFINGYIGTNVYHNPTTLLLKPFALLQFYYSIEAFRAEKSDWKVYAIAIISSLISVYTKPNLVICLLPALCVVGSIRLARRKTVDWKILLFGIILPSTVILVWQYFTTYGSNSDSIILAPLKVMEHYSSKLLLKFLLSIVFPVVVTVVYWRDAIKHIYLQFGWLLFGFGAAVSYLFAETGQRSFSGNFIWSGEITLFLLFVGCILFISEMSFSRLSGLKRWLLLSSGFLHVVFGIVYYFYLYFNL